MAKKEDRRLFELDRRMELKLRLAVKRIEGDTAPVPSEAPEIPAREVVQRLIARVRSL